MPIQRFEPRGRRFTNCHYYYYYYYYYWLLKSVSSSHPPDLTWAALSAAQVRRPITIVAAATHHTWSQHGGSMALYAHYHTHVATNVRTAATSSPALTGIFLDVVHPNRRTAASSTNARPHHTRCFLRLSTSVISNWHFVVPRVFRLVSRREWNGILDVRAVSLSV